MLSGHITNVTPVDEVLNAIQPGDLADGKLSPNSPFSVPKSLNFSKKTSRVYPVSSKGFSGSTDLLGKIF